MSEQTPVERLEADLAYWKREHHIRSAAVDGHESDRDRVESELFARGALAALERLAALPGEQQRTARVGWERKRVLACFRCGPVDPADVKPAADDEDVMVHDAPLSLAAQRRTGRSEGICGAEVCWTEVAPASALRSPSPEARVELDGAEAHELFAAILSLGHDNSDVHPGHPLRTGIDKLAAGMDESHPRFSTPLEPAPSNEGEGARVRKNRTGKLVYPTAEAQRVAELEGCLRDIAGNCPDPGWAEQARAALSGEGEKE
jgi:hypothetical protein